MKDMSGHLDQEPVLKYLQPDEILVVLPVLNESRHIVSTLDQLLGGASQLRDVCVVVADGGSDDSTRARVEALKKDYPNLKLLHNPKKLQSDAVNLAVEVYANDRHKVLVRCDAHANYPSDYIFQVADRVVELGVAAVATVMDSRGESCFQRGVAWASDTKMGSGGSGHRGGTASGYVDHGHHAGFLLDSWRNIGGYAANYPTNEDAELDHRLGLAGYKIWLDAEIRMEYQVRKSIGKLARQYFKYGQGRARTIMRHRIRPKARQMLPVLALLANAFSLALSPLHWSFLIPLLVYLAVAFAAAGQIVLRKGSLCGVMAAPAMVAMHMAWGAGFLRQILSPKGDTHAR